VTAEIKDMIISLDITQDNDLIKEGYAREITRRIQSERKNLGLNKKDIVRINIECSGMIKDAVKEYHNIIFAKVGTDKILINEKIIDAMRTEHKVKDEAFVIEIKRL